MSNKYPTVFLHGFFGFGEADGVDKVIPYWGVRQDRKLLPYLEKNGFETYHPSISPFNSGWDRACVLYAYLFGGRVDYGKVHSEKYHHERFGRTYPGVLKDLGKTEAHKKINIVGHSFGGPAVICFAGLMTHGAPEEVAATDPDDLNPLFKGGQGHLIHTASTTAPPLPPGCGSSALTLSTTWSCFWTSSSGTPHSPGSGTFIWTSSASTRTRRRPKCSISRTPSSTGNSSRSMTTFTWTASATK